MEAVFLFGFLLIVGLILGVFVISPKGKKWLNTLD